MTYVIIIDAHLHLNGSISWEFLEDAATRNDCLAVYQTLLSENDPWKKFGLIHQIIQETEDIIRATIDVVKNTNANILEIRSTPKAMKEKNLSAYIEAFTTGLLEAKRLYPNKKARGLLSIDRTRHSLEEAKWIIDMALKVKQISGMIVGIDLSGNYLAERKLTSNNLYETIKYALNKDIGLALHVGESDSETEKNDFDLILKAIEEYSGRIHGKVRLGHAIYRTPSQEEIIRKLEIPVEICLSCHQQLEWWKQDKPHPILTLYQDRSCVLSGTDDSFIFGCNAYEEQRKVDEVLKISNKLLHLSEEDQNKVVAEKRKSYLF